MTWIGCVLMVSGWLIAIVALVLFGGLGERLVFVGAGLLVEILGLGLLGQSFKLQQRPADPQRLRGIR